MAEKKRKEGIPEGQAKYCEGCGKKIHVKAKVCPHCGFGKDSRADSDKSNKKTLAIVGLIINIFVLPGLGTIIGGETSKGITQLVLFIVSIPLMLILIGIPLAIAMWIWALVTSINQIKNTD